LDTDTAIIFLKTFYDNSTNSDFQGNTIRIRENLRNTACAEVSQCFGGNTTINFKENIPHQLLLLIILYQHSLASTTAFQLLYVMTAEVDRT
jgi:hypothetical protein